MDDEANGIEITPSSLLVGGTAIILLLVAMLVIFDIGLFIIGFFSAQEVKCNFLWCEFKSTYGTAQITETRTQTCYQNGTLIDCNKMAR
jgi:preprotein translocase subunit Sec61beta